MSEGIKTRIESILTGLQQHGVFHKAREAIFWYPNGDSQPEFGGMRMPVYHRGYHDKRKGRRGRET